MKYFAHIAFAILVAVFGVYPETGWITATAVGALGVRTVLEDWLRDYDEKAEQKHQKGQA